jgi:hypothetical protein
MHREIDRETNACEERFQGYKSGFVLWDFSHFIDLIFSGVGVLGRGSPSPHPHPLPRPRPAPRRAMPPARPAGARPPSPRPAAETRPSSPRPGALPPALVWDLCLRRRLLHRRVHWRLCQDQYHGLGTAREKQSMVRHFVRQELLSDSDSGHHRPFAFRSIIFAFTRVHSRSFAADTSVQTSFAADTPPPPRKMGVASLIWDLASPTKGAFVDKIRRPKISFVAEICRPNPTTKIVDQNCPPKLSTKYFTRALAGSR